MKMRKITSLTATLSFVLMVLTSIILYIVPQGRVAYWADWHLWGLSKTEWGNIHINLGLLFLISLFLHITYNWKPLVSYLKDKGRRFRLFTREFNIALIVTLAFAAGTYLMIPPFSWVMALNDQFKEIGVEKYGEPPYGHAELSSLRTLAKRMNLDLEKSMGLLEKAGYPVADAAETLESIGRRYDVTPQQIFMVMEPAKAEGGSGTAEKARLPESPVPGTGNATLADFCTQYGLNMKTVVRRLGDRGIKAAEALTLKQIAEDNRIAALDLYQVIREVVDSSGK